MYCLMDGFDFVLVHGKKCSRIGSLMVIACRVVSIDSAKDLVAVSN